MVDVAVSTGTDAAWDRFVHEAGGSHLQTSRWGAVKATHGWRSARVVLRDGGTIVGGAQILLRPVAPGVTIAYAPRAPVTGADRRHDTTILDAVRALCRRERVVYLKLQPPDGRSDLEGVLASRGFARSDLEAAPTATVRVDLSGSEDEILAAMRTTTRANVRKSARRGVVVREGSTEDMRTYKAVIDATAARQGFHPYPYEYYRAQWDAFSPGGHAGLLLTEVQGSVVSVALLIAYGDTVLYKMGGWTGDGVRDRPNEAMHWAALRWARDRGYRWYDFEGIKPASAEAVLAGREVPGVDGFKLGWGGEVAVFPAAHDVSPVRVLAPAVRAMAPRLESLRGVAHRLLGRQS